MDNLNPQKTWRDLPKDTRLRITAYRQAILEILETTAENLSAKDIYLRMHRRYPAIGVASIYRNLDILVRFAVVERTDLADGGAFYELSEQYHPMGHHHHLICEVCGQVVSYNDFLEKELACMQFVQEQLSQKYRFNITRHVLRFMGQCEICQGKE